MKKTSPLLDLCNFTTSKKKNVNKRKTKTFFNKFDQGTELKLDLFEKTIKSWIPVFTSQNYITTINIIDFFAGEGKDSLGKKGSPLKVLDTIKSYKNLIRNRSSPLKIKLHLNDDKPIITSALKAHLNEILKTTPDYLDISISTKPFQDIFYELLPQLQKPDVANFLFIDPFGLALTKKLFQQISSLKRTDFILFTPVTNVQRFCEQDGFANHFPGLKRSHFENPKTAHRKLCDYMQENWADSGYYLHAFAIQKETGNRHCLIFGSSNQLGVYKFIETCWKEDQENGESNFAFEGDLKTSECLIIPELAGSKKVKNFKESLENLIKAKKIKSNKDIFDYALKAGFHPPSKHIKSTLKTLKNNKIINNNLTRFGLSYASVMKGVVDLEFIS
ncbi:three-Cys-motif partner protein TcmP [Desulfovibrio gilichinskyi]|uniref:Three-Cys-motif partner protein n=1 Tax=Desulfovibrio gilichinskyi TaxID=1519643 RepID=A0A1X7CHQ1_9BACT|nr:three-Cys-motif partner protein TcmP [Desulfovibrio gilichinskyi]SME96786.1 three-Cys-motif partner protein [Desulfovibrio gilichinskyi]